MCNEWESGPAQDEGEFKITIAQFTPVAEISCNDSWRHLGGDTGPYGCRLDFNFLNPTLYPHYKSKDKSETNSVGEYSGKLSGDFNLSL